MRAQTQDRTPANVLMQGVNVPRSNVDPVAFFKATRRQTLLMKSFNFGGLGNTDNIQLLQTGIISGLQVRLTGTVTVTHGTGAIATTARWPYDVIKRLRVAVNGQAQLINCSGAKLKAREIMSLGDLTSRGVPQGIGGASPGTSRTQGTMSLNNESWGVGQSVTAIAGGTYNVDLSYFVPLAMDQRDLVGAIFAQTSATELAVSFDWANATDLFVVTGNDTVAVSLQVLVYAHVYTIPQAPNGGVIVPDLSAFHSLIETRYPNPGLGSNEIKLVGASVGRQLMRVFFQVWNGATPAPLALNTTNYVNVGWRFGANDTPEYLDAKALAYWNEKLFDDDLATFYGIGCLDFCSEFAVRDSINEGLATELRLLLEIANGVTLTSPVVEYVQETVFAGAAGA